MRSHHRQAGFTLIEILIALVIFAVVGVMAALSLHTMIRAHAKLKKTDRETVQLEVAMTMMRRDFSETIHRQITDEIGAQEPAFLASGSGEILLTRAGLVNPLQLSQQSNMQRVGYALEGDQLVRLTWNVLDQSPQTTSEKQVLLRGVQSLQWTFIADNGSQFSNWPLANMTALQSPLPKAVYMVMHVANVGVMQTVFPIPARGFYGN